MSRFIIQSRLRSWQAFLPFCCAFHVHAGGLPLDSNQVEETSLPTITVTAPLTFNLLGVANTASQGTVTQAQLKNRPLLRPAEILETVPGLIVTQHSGDGKANQYFLRGFNLDHGTDLASFVDGVSVNMPSHAHGQGYSDLNFLIPELVNFIQYRKGPYNAADGDFASAGSVRIEQMRQLKENFVELTGGSFGYERLLAAGTTEYLGGQLLGAVDVSHSNGPWDVAENSEKQNVQLRYSRGTLNDGWSLAFSHYQSDWGSTDQVAQRAIDDGLIGRYGSLNPSDGGETKRTALTFNWADTTLTEQRKLDLFALHYKLNLFSDFTYYLNDPIHGDQFEQLDERNVFGGRYEQSFFSNLLTYPMQNKFGISARHDAISSDGLFLTENRVRYATISDDKVNETTVALYAENTLNWTPYFRSTFGLRTDFYHFDVDANIAQNSGNLNAHKTSPKIGFVFGPFGKTEYYLNYGYGFHSNDARGTTLRINPDPRDAGYLSPVNTVSPLVRTKGGELGLRTEILPHLHSTIALWQLDSDSELVFVGDAGTTEASRPSRRRGIEWTNYYQPSKAWQIDFDAAFSQAKFTDDDLVGNHIPDAIGTTSSMGIAYTPNSPWSVGLRLRYFGPRPLIEDNSVRSTASTLVNAQAGYQFSKHLSGKLEILNLFNRQVNDIEYLYNSCLRSDSATAECSASSTNREGFLDRHIHPAESRAVRASLRVSF
ncbi:TonB-dependent receptor [Aquirhabdus parva]|uniref:TonB-dependent receptor n=2 Tax=Aquirhabdus parva TaxID=2283318 RepID=A0A345PAX7_9GAMM|nr:TonB-dependent receptor [Aquirhabdus parva]